MSTQLSPNLGLRLTDQMTLDEKYNLNKIDGLAARVPSSSTGNVSFSSEGELKLSANSLTQVDGVITLAAGGLSANDTASRTIIQAREIVLAGYVSSSDTNSSSLDLKVSSINFNGAALLNLDLSSLPSANASTTGMLLNTDWVKFNEAYASRHSHTNSAILAATTAAFTTALKNKYDASAAAGGFTTYSKTLSLSDITAGYINLPSQPASPSDTLVLPEGAPTQAYSSDYIVEEDKVVFKKDNMDSLGNLLEEGDSLLILYR